MLDNFQGHAIDVCKALIGKSRASLRIVHGQGNVLLTHPYRSVK